MIAYTPKATVQAAIGGVPLALGLSCGQTVLTVSVMTFFKSERFNFNPARINIIIRAILRISDEIVRIDGSIRFKAYGPMIIPAIIMPNKLGK